MPCGGRLIAAASGYLLQMPTIKEIPMTMLPTVDFFGKKVTRLICGGNPLSGYSHVSERSTAK